MPTPHGLVRLVGSERRPLRGAARVADADPAELIAVTIRVRRRANGPPLPSLEELGKIPLNRRRFPSREEFARRHGAAPEDFAAVTAFAEAHGLKVAEQSAGQRTMSVTGSVRAMEAAFGVKLHRYRTSTETYRGHEGFVHIPQTLADIVESVLGLDTRRVVRTRAATTGTATTPAGNAVVPGNSGPAGASPLTPPKVASLYGFPTSSAAGQTIGILEFGGGYAKSDITAFLSPVGIATPSIVDQSVDGGSNTPAGSVANVTANDPDLEVTLDIDVVASVAVGANIVVYFAPNTEQAFADAVSKAVHDTTNAPTIITCSWYGSEDGWSGSARSSMVTALNDAAALGVTVFFITGDDGSDDGVGDGSAHVAYPASEYGAIACGGAYIANVLGSSFTEGTWNDVGATGGGVSDVYGLPAWQDNIGVPKSANDGTTVGRGVPDVAGNASPFSGYTLTLYDTLTTSLTITSGAGAGSPLGTIGGTSAVAPLYAALLALIEAQIGEPLGYLTPLLYALQQDGPFVDINDGANNEWSGEAKPAPSYTSTGRMGRLHRSRSHRRRQIARRIPAGLRQAGELQNGAKHLLAGRGGAAIARRRRVPSLLGRGRRVPPEGPGPQCRQPRFAAYLLDSDNRRAGFRSHSAAGGGNRDRVHAGGRPVHAARGAPGPQPAERAAAFPLPVHR